MALKSRRFLSRFSGIHQGSTRFSQTCTRNHSFIASESIQTPCHQLIINHSGDLEAQLASSAAVIGRSGAFRSGTMVWQVSRVTVMSLAGALCMIAGKAGASELWSSPTTWQGAIPMAGEIVTVPAGSDILLDTDLPELGGLIVRGKLSFARQDLALSSRWILIDGGSLHIGAEDALHTDQVVITLTGSEDEENTAGSPPPHMGKKFFGVINGGRLEMHGARAHARNWTQLTAHAPADSTQLEVADEVDWKTGDRLVIAPSGFDPLEAEEVTVTSVSDGMVYFTPPLQHDHWGELQVIGGHTIDERAEVACLTRNIVIQGDEASADSDFGGHLMFRPGTTAHVEGVEFNRMGQKGHAGRYPIHWHVTGDRSGDYARGNSIHHSYHRAVVVHGSSHVLVENNVSYDVWSHAFVPSEDGSETGNRFVGNLAVLTRQLALGDYAFPGSGSSGASSQSEGRPGAFWMRSPQHRLIGNHVAGVINGMGFFVDGPGPSDDWAGAFDNNTAHACSSPSGSSLDWYRPLTKGFGLFIGNHLKPTEIVFNGFTAYKNTLSGIWLEAPGQRAANTVLADNGTGAMLYQSGLENSVIVGQSANTIGALPAVGTSLTGGLHLGPDNELKAPQLRNIDFIDQRDAGIVVLGTRLHPQSRFENLSFSNTQPCWIEEPSLLIGGFTDVDGSIRGDGVPVFIHGNDVLVETAETEFDASANSWITPLSNLQFLSLTDPHPAAYDLGFTVLMGETQTGELADTTLRGGAPTISGYLQKDSNYTVLRFDPLPAGVRVSVDGTEPGSIFLDLPFIGPASVYEQTTSAFGTSVPDFADMAPEASSIGEITGSTQMSWYDDPPTESLLLRLRENEAVYVFDQPSGGLAFTSPEALWQSQQFGYHLVQDQAAENIWGSFADPDQDGLQNIMEFFLSSHPLQHSEPLEFDPALHRLSFIRNPAAVDLGFSVSYSDDLLSWHSDLVIQESELPTGAIQVNATAPFSSSNRMFMVLKVHHLP